MDSQGWLQAYAMLALDQLIGCLPALVDLAVAETRSTVLINADRPVGGHFEQQVGFLPSPPFVLSEGLGLHAQDLVFPRGRRLPDPVGTGRRRHARRHGRAVHRAGAVTRTSSPTTTDGGCCATGWTAGPSGSGDC